MHRPHRMNVAFDARHLQERGTDVALFDYALGNEELLGNRSFILSPARADLRALDKFRARFSVLLYRDANNSGTLDATDLQRDIARAAESDDLKEGAAAWAEKRTPNFKGR